MAFHTFKRANGIIMIVPGVFTDKILIQKIKRSIKIIVYGALILRNAYLELCLLQGCLFVKDACSGRGEFNQGNMVHHVWQLSRYADLCHAIFFIMEAHR